jgi:hypothetical protein
MNEEEKEEEKEEEEEEEGVLLSLTLASVRCFLAGRFSSSSLLVFLCWDFLAFFCWDFLAFFIRE